jgi:MoaA/NifB/PqqE/SkfB family radical SAM enzyme
MTIAEIRRLARSSLKRVPGLQSTVLGLRRARQALERRKVEHRKLPACIAIELTNNCNLQCAKCPTNESGRARGYLDGSLYRKLLSDVERAGTPVEIALSGAGEPTLHPRVVDFVHYARRLPNVTVTGFATNAVVLTPELSEGLLAAGLNRIKLSLDTDDRVEYLRFNRVDAYEQAVKNLEYFLKVRKSAPYNCVVTLKVTLYKRNVEMANRMRERWGPLIDQLRVTGLHNWAGLRGKRTGPARTQACDVLWNHVQILWDGQITLCCLDSMEGFFNMGNLANRDISEYWRHDEGLNRIRRQHLCGDFSGLPVCARCSADIYGPVRVD